MLTTEKKRKRRGGEETKVSILIDLPNEIWNYIMTFALESQRDRETYMPIYYNRPLLSERQWHAIYHVYKAKHISFNK